MTEPYHIQKERIRQELIEAHRPFDFYESDRFKTLNDELQEANEAMDVETGIDIMADIEVARKNFNKSLPWFYSARWDFNLMLNDPETYKEALKEYEKNIYVKKF